MFTIKWSDPPKGCLKVIGEIDAIAEIAHLLNKRKQFFKVYSVDGMTFSQKQMGWNFEYMLEPTQIWP